MMLLGTHTKVASLGICSPTRGKGSGKSLRSLPWRLNAPGRPRASSAHGGRLGRAGPVTKRERCADEEGGAVEGRGREGWRCWPPDILREEPAPADAAALQELHSQQPRQPPLGPLAPVSPTLLRPNTATLCLTLVSHIHLRPPVIPTCSTQGQSAHLLHYGPLSPPCLRRPPGVPPQQSQLRPQSARALWGPPTLADPVSSHWRVQRDRPPCCSPSSWTCPGHTLSLGHQGSSLTTDLNSRPTFSVG